MDDKFYVQCSYDYTRTCSEYSTLWMTYVCGPDYTRKKVRIRHFFDNVFCLEMHIWGFLRDKVGVLLDNKGLMTMKDLEKLIKVTKHFSRNEWSESSECYEWDYSLRRYVVRWSGDSDGEDKSKELEERYKSFIGSNYGIITSDPMEARREGNRSWKVLVKEIGKDKAIPHDNGKQFMRDIRDYEIEATIVSLENNKELVIKERVFCPDNWPPLGELEKVLCEYEERCGEIVNPEEIDLEKLSSIADNRREMMRHLFY